MLVLCCVNLNIVQVGLMGSQESAVQKEHYKFYPPLIFAIMSSCLSPPLQPQVEALSVGPLMRIELKLVQSGLGGIWGMSVDRIAVRDVAAGAMVEFPAAGQWLGASPSPSSPSAPNQQVSQQQQAVIGVQSMRLMPAGTFAATFSARWVVWLLEGSIIFSIQV